MSVPVALPEEDLLAALDSTLSQVEDARELVGLAIPVVARHWANRHGLPWRETSFCPPGRLFIVGAVAVPPGVLIP